MQKIVQLFAMACSLTLFAACQTASDRGNSNIFPPIPADPALGHGFSAEEIATARSLYVNKCLRCHEHYNPADYEASEWDVWMKKMSKKAKLQTVQEEVLTRYLAHFRRPTTAQKKQ
jgi:hypothetical protein